MDKISTHISGRLKQLRSERRLSLDELADKTGFTKSYLSKIENAKNVPPIGSLARISAALGIELSQIFQDDSSDAEADPQAAVVRATQRRSVVRGGTTFGYDYQSLGGRFPTKRMDPFVFTFPTELGEDVFFEHEGQEFVFVLSGQLEFRVGDEEWVLRAGDSIIFDASLPHRGRAVNDDAKALVVISSDDSEPS